MHDDYICIGLHSVAIDIGFGLKIDLELIKLSSRWLLKVWTIVGNILHVLLSKYDLNMSQSRYSETVVK